MRTVKSGTGSTHSDPTPALSAARGRDRRGRPGRSRSIEIGSGRGRSVRTSSMNTGPPHRMQRKAPREAAVLTPSAGRNVPFFND